VAEQTENQEDDFEVERQVEGRRRRHCRCLLAACYASLICLCEFRHHRLCRSFSLISNTLPLNLSSFADSQCMFRSHHHLYPIIDHHCLQSPSMSVFWLCIVTPFASHTGRPSVPVATVSGSTTTMTPATRTGTGATLFSHIGMMRRRGTSSAHSGYW